MTSPLPCGIGVFEKYIPDDAWFETGAKMMLSGETQPVLYMRLVAENILDAFGRAGLEVCLPALTAAEQALVANPLTEKNIRYVLSDLLVELRQALSQSHLSAS